MPNKSRKIIEILHRYNKNDHSNVCTRHFGTRVFRNLRDIVVCGEPERIAEVTIRGEEVHVAVPIWGAAHIIPRQAWELVYGPADERTATPVNGRTS